MKKESLYKIIDRTWDDGRKEGKQELGTGKGEYKTKGGRKKEEKELGRRLCRRLRHRWRKRQWRTRALFITDRLFSAHVFLNRCLRPEHFS